MRTTQTKYFRLKNVIFLSPHYLWRKDQFIQWLEDEEDEHASKDDAKKRPTLLDLEIDPGEKYWSRFITD